MRKVGHDDSEEEDEDEDEENANENANENDMNEEEEEEDVHDDDFYDQQNHYLSGRSSIPIPMASIQLQRLFVFMQENLYAACAFYGHLPELASVGSASKFASLLFSLLVDTVEDTYHPSTSTSSSSSMSMASESNLQPKKRNKVSECMYIMIIIKISISLSMNSF